MELASWLPKYGYRSWSIIGFLRFVSPFDLTMRVFQVVKAQDRLVYKTLPRGYGARRRTDFFFPSIQNLNMYGCVKYELEVADGPRCSHRRPRFLHVVTFGYPRHHNFGSADGSAYGIAMRDD